MKVTSAEKKEKSTVELVIEVGAEEFEAAVQKAYLKRRANINVPGFRKGKAPRKLIERLYGSGVFYEDAVNEVYPAAYAEAVAEQKLDEVGYPKIEVVSVGKEGLTFKAIVSVRPEVKLSAYKGLTAPKASVKVTEKDIDGELAPYVDRATRLVNVKRKSKKGDTAVIDFEGFMDGKPFEGGKGENYSLELGSGSFIPGFEDQVIGMKAGDEKSLELKFPEDYIKDLAGKDVTFKVKVNEVKEPVKPELDDEFAKDVSEFETLADFRKDLGEKLAERREEQAKREYEDAVMEQLIANLTADIPDTMVDVQVDKMMDDFAARLSAQGMQMEQYLQMVGMNEQMMRQSARPNALKQVQLELALGAVADKEKLDATDDEVTDEYARMAEQYKVEIDRVRAAIPVDDIRHDLRMKKATDFVLANAKVGATKKPAAKKAEDAPAEEKKPAAKKTAAAKAAEEKKPAAKKTTTAKAAEEKKPAAKKTTTAKTAEEKKPAAKKTAAKATEEKKPAAKKTSTAKAAEEKKPAAKKAASKKA